MSNQLFYWTSGIIIFIVGLCLTILSLITAAVYQEYIFVLIGILQGVVTVFGASSNFVNWMLIREQYRLYD